MKNIIEKIRNDEKLQEILFVLLYAAILVWSFICVILTAMNQPTVDDLTVQEQIKYERMIFP